MSEAAIDHDVARVNAWAPSREILSAASDELVRLEAEIAGVRAEEARLEHELEIARQSRAAVEEQVDLLRRISEHRTSDPLLRRPPSRLRVIASSAAPATTVLRGAQIRERAVQLLVETGQPDQAVHYRAWFELLRRRGYTAAGKEPLATFLTQINRSPVVQRSTAPGMYSLNLGFPEHARSLLAKLEAQRHALDRLAPAATVADIRKSQEQQALIAAEIAKVGGTLEEADRSLRPLAVQRDGQGDTQTSKGTEE